jgi:hypothetical protein
VVEDESEARHVSCKFEYDDTGNVTRISCSRGGPACSRCGARASLACDFPLRGKAAGKTRSKPMRGPCATNVGPNRDYCVVHARIAGLAVS